MTGISHAVERFAAFLRGDAPTPTPQDFSSVEASSEVEVATMACVLFASAWYADQSSPPVMVVMMLDRAVETGAIADELRPLVDVALADLRLHDEGEAAFDQAHAFASDYDSSGLDEAIDLLRGFRAGGGRRLEIRQDCIAQLMAALWLRWQDSGQDADLDEVILIGEEEGELRQQAAELFDAAIVARTAGAATDVYRNVRFEIAMMLRDARANAYERTHEVVHLEEMIRLGWVAIPFASRADKPELFTTHADALQARFRLSGSVEDLDEAITALRKQRIHYPENDDGWLDATVRLRGLLLDRSMADELPTDLSEIIDLNDDLLRDARIQEDDRIALLWSQAKSLWERSRRTMSLEDLGRAVSAGHELVGLVGDSDPGLLSSVGLFVFEWFSRTRDRDDLRLAIDMGRRSLHVAAEQVDEQARRLANLFAAELTLADETGLAPDYDTAIATAAAAIELFDESDPLRAKHLGNVAAAWCGRFQRSGAEDDLQQALQHARSALRGATDSEKIRCGAILLVSLAYRLDRFDDPAALDEAVELLEAGWHLDLAWLNSVRELVDVVQRRGDELALDRRISDAMLSTLHKGLLRMSVEMVNEGASRRSPMLLNVAMALVDLTEFIHGAPNPAIYQGLRGQVLRFQWQLNGVRGDLDTAIELLVSAASEVASSAPEWASENLQTAAHLLYRRYRRRRHRVDMEEACRHLERALALAGDDADERSDMEATLRLYHGHLANPAMMMNHVDLGEDDRENLASPQAMAAVQAWNSGEPRESGLVWVHADEGGDEADPPGSPRVLFLRTFNDDHTGYAVINSLAAALDGGAGRIEIVSDQRDRDTIDHQWTAAFGGRPTSERIDFITSSQEAWRRVVLERMFAADVIVLHLSPKDVDFPEFPFAPSNNEIPTGEDFWTGYVNSPLARPITGPGLLREVSYLNRTNMLPITVVVCDKRYQETLNDLIALSGAMGDATDLAGNFITPRLAAIDKQVGHLRRAYRGITFDCHEDAPVQPHLAAAIRRTLAGMRAEKIARQPPPWRLKDVSGRTREPRGLPPDNKPKIIAFTAIEDVLFLPQGEITEISRGEMLTILDREAIAHGCPYCRAPVERIFFFVNGLKTAEERAESGLSHVRARCQICGRRSTYDGTGYLDPQ